MRWAVALLLLTACATPRGEGRLVERLAPARVERWPRPVPVGEAAGVEVTQGALSDAEARALPAVCMDVVRRELGATVPAQAPQWRIVLSRLVVDTHKDARGDRLVRARALLEIRTERKPLAVANGLAFLKSGTPSFRSDDVEPSEVRRTVEEACKQAITQLKKPSEKLADAELARLRAEAISDDPDVRAAAIHRLGEAQSLEDAALLLRALEDSDAQVRRFAAWGLGELAHGPAAEALARRAELDTDFGVRTEAVVALNKMLAAEPSLRPVIRSTREAAATEREATPPAPEPPPAEEPDQESRVIEPESP